MERVQRLPANPHGRDIAVGDLHGHRARLERELDRIGFDPARDRLICVGDLVDRGPECADVVALVDEPWFHTVRGNHDLSVIAAFAPERDPDTAGPRGPGLICEAHAWMRPLSAAARERLLERLLRLPYALEIDTAAGRVGIVHAEVPSRIGSWDELVAGVADETGGGPLREAICWERALAWRAAPCEGECPEGDGDRLPDVAWVIHGHTPMAQPPRGTYIGWRGNRFWIDTGGWLDAEVGRSWDHPPGFTLVDITAPWRAL